MPNRSPTQDPSVQLEALAHEIYASLADQFPVCMASDEFHFFPQFQHPTLDGSSLWDDFSDSAVDAFFINLARWQGRLHQLVPKLADSSSLMDIQMLTRVLTTLEEQLRLGRPHKTQPTFYLTILSIGLADALEQSRDAFDRRIGTLPDFLDAARTNLPRVPALFAELALEMGPKLVQWIMSLPMADGKRQAVLEALNRFHVHVQQVGENVDFRLPKDVYARVADFHMGCRMALDEIAWHLDEEIQTATRHLVQSAHRISPNTRWQTVFQQLPAPDTTDDERHTLYRRKIERLKTHCRDHGFFTAETVDGCDVDIQTITEHMMPVRSNAAYAMPPGHPPKGGVFYVLPADKQALPRDMRMLLAHETYPGHHLLDTRRWRLSRPLRRSLEFPLFYEGWASFGEEILFDTGFFAGATDRLLMAKRRFWRALRGRAEFNIHTGKWRLEQATSELADIGLVDHQQARAMVRRYALKPGYQLSYAIGRRKFKQLYKAYIALGRTPGQFIREALSEGEIEFHKMTEKMFRPNGTSDAKGRQRWKIS